MATSIATNDNQGVYVFYDMHEGDWRVTKVKYFKNGQEEGRFVSSGIRVATDRAKQEFEAYLDDPEIAEEGQAFLDLLAEAQRKFEDEQRELGA